MILQCLTEREGNTEILSGGFKFTFRPNEAGHSVCDINAQGVVSQLLSLPWFREYTPSHPFKLTRVSGRDEHRNPVVTWEASVYGTDFTATGTTAEECLEKAKATFKAPEKKVEPKTEPKSLSPAERDAEMVRLFKSGLSVPAVAEKVGLSRSRVHTRLKELGAK